MENLVSIVVTCYNHEKYIEQCLRSIFDQTYKNIELIVINDGSTDESDKIIKRVLQEAPFIKHKYIFHSNRGLVVSRNIGLDNITGEFLLFVDSDNYLENNYVESLVRTAIDNEADIVYTNLINPVNNTIVLEAAEFQLERLYRENFIDACSLIRVNKIYETKFDLFLNYKKLEDYDFYFNLIVVNGARPIPCYDTCLYYRVLSESMSDRENRVLYYELYSYILGKYLKYNPELATKAIQFHFSNLSRLDIEHSINEEKISFYFSNSQDFPDTPAYQERIKFQDEIEIPVKKGKNYIRIKPSNIPSFYEKFILKSKKYQTEILPMLSNGIVDENSLIFGDFYPFIDYRFNLSENDKLVLSYKRFNINDIVAKDYIGKILAKQSYNRLQTILSYERKQRQLESDINTLNNDYDILLSNYRKVTDAVWWKIPTKIINFFRRKK
ncbi:glycosyltransferase family 2 protein [Streptococcus equinus]|uniref:glycosyltransferase family 2 protein n=1 Tax=Streptococcus equinus TaxID=1335 RepID=UPI00087FF688|nr:glycosyltransferase family 2 protein [Streptococcus equinus]SDQ22303.1 Glycosyltransferase involved in cell wall bisynthesis [Streptococcus equinus]